MKRIMLLLLSVAIMLCGCAPLVDESDTLDVYASFYPVYALLDGLVTGVPDMQLHCLVQPQDGCLRDYELSDWDLYLLASSADAVIMAGRGLESFESMLFGLGDHGPAVAAVLYNLELYNQDDTEVSEESSHFDGVNPHLYMSVNGAIEMLESMNASLISMDPRYTDIYESNLKSAEAKLLDLGAELHDMTHGVAGNAVALMNEALVYVAQDYGLDVKMYWDRESGASVYDSDLNDCLQKLSDSGVKVVLIEKQAPAAFVDALENAGYTVAKIDIMSDHRQREGFADYLETQRKNAAAISGAFEKN